MSQKSDKRPSHKHTHNDKTQNLFLKYTVKMNTVIIHNVSMHFVDATSVDKRECT